VPYPLCHVTVLRVRAAENDALLPEEEASDIEQTFPGLSPPIPSPTEPNVMLHRSHRSPAGGSNPLRFAFDFSKPDHASPQQDAPAPTGSWPLDRVTGGEASSSSPPAHQLSPASAGRSEGGPTGLSGGISDLSLPRDTRSTPGASTPTPRSSAQAHRYYERPWDSVHTHDNALFADQSPAASGDTSGGLRAPTPASTQKLAERCDADMPRDAARMPSPDENSSENLPILSK
jgi:hypothetical protein